ncbi:hypothetical protein M408DRAFT_331040 [Serendipita vermifera MAFF 305830]|uniref:DUF431-domain-containing protein n=1 Tax=Serendipita vermifera MAFF 305830 TaxID=933852 RepID=A0A0C2X906_SERVB|nr:hypothetical protein M408DRAFT_331040 [Serendipita vermifera MAFF 305830]
MEEDEQDQVSSLPRWVLLEYSQMLKLAGKDSTVAFTHLSKSSCAALDRALTENHPSKDSSSTASFESHTISILELMKTRNVPLERVCLLDPKAPQELGPDDGNGKFEWFLFGGILGDDPPRDRTGELRSLGFPTRHLGPVQMTTDTALGVTKLIVEDKNTLSGIPYLDHPTIRFSKTESVEMPFRYIMRDGEPVLPPGMKQHFYEDLNRVFDD